MQYHTAGGHARVGGAWGLLPPLLPTGEPIAAADVLDTNAFLDTELVFPISRSGNRTDLTFFYWQTYAATIRGKEALQQVCRNPIQCSPACTAENDKLWLMRPPSISGCIDDKKTNIVWHPTYPDRHPLSHLSGRIRSLGNIHISEHKVKDYDLFYLSEYPVFLLISERLVNTLHDMGVTGCGAMGYPAIVMA